MLRDMSLILALVCGSAGTATAQWVEPAAVTAIAQPADTIPVGPVSQGDFRRPRTVIVAPAAFLLGAAGGAAGYYYAEAQCAPYSGDCMLHLLTVPIGYVSGVAIGGGIAGAAEGCSTGLLRSTAGAVLGFAAGLAVAQGSKLGLLTVPAGPLVGATWLVNRCRTRRNTASPGS